MTNRVIIGLGFLGLFFMGLAILLSPEPVRIDRSDMRADQVSPRENLSTVGPQMSPSEAFVKISPAGVSNPNKLIVQGDLRELRQGGIIRFELDNRISEFRIEGVDQSKGITSLLARGSVNPAEERLRVTLGAGEAVGTVSTSVGVYELTGGLESLTYVRVSDLLRLKPGEDYKLRAAPKELAAQPKQPMLGAP